MKLVEACLRTTTCREPISGDIMHPRLESSMYAGNAIRATPTCAVVRQRTTTHTFILYLTDNRVGGETVLLQKLKQPSGVRAEVTPRRGRLLLFPHGCPHLARQVVAEGLPKLLLRGEML